jgi:hypothetical protein
MALPCGLLDATPSRNTRVNSPYCVMSRSTPLTCPHVLSTSDMSSCVVHKGRWAISPNPLIPLDKCPHKSTQLSHRGVRSGECLRKLQTSTLPLNEGGILCHAKSVTEVLELRPGKGFGKNISNVLICRKVLH